MPRYRASTQPMQIVKQERPDLRETGDILDEIDRCGGVETVLKGNPLAPSGWPL